jgi:hypothetical protein
VEAFGSRAGSTFRGRGPTATSDLDLIAAINSAQLGGRNSPWIRRVLKSIAADFEKEAGCPLNIHASEMPHVFKSGLRGTPFLLLEAR